MIRYSDSVTDTCAENLTGGFFEGWPNPPSPEAHLRILQGSFAVELAMDDATGLVVGFLTAISDGVSSAYLPHLEVLPAYRKQGIGGELVRRMLARLKEIYMVDLSCDPDLRPYYERLGFRPMTGMATRNYGRQDCSPLGPASA